VKVSDVDVGGDHTVFTVTTPAGRVYKATAEWSEGVLNLTSLTVSAENVTGQVLGEVPVAGIRDAIADYLRNKNPSLIDNSGRAWPMFGIDTPVELAGISARQRITDDFLRDVAMAYLQTLEEAPRRPVQHLAEKLGISDNRQRIASWVARARRDDWLTKAVPGKAGARPGPRLKRWLKSQAAGT
jgi:hypothetical protein